jgi:hypothetical protein
MERRKALTLAGSAAMVVAAGGIAMAANFGVLGVAGAGDGSVGTLDANTVSGLAETTTTAPAEPQVVVIDQYDVVPGQTGPTDDAGDDAAADSDHEGDDSNGQAPGASTPTPTAGPAPTVTTSPHESDDEEHEEPEAEHEDEHEVEHDDD